MTNSAGMCYASALNLVKSGNVMRRKDWAASEFVFLVPGSTFTVSRQPLLGIFAEGTQIVYRSHIDKRNSDGTIGVWTPSNEDQLADDWVMVPKSEI